MDRTKLRQDLKEIHAKLGALEEKLRASDDVDEQYLAEDIYNAYIEVDVALAEVKAWF